MTRTIPGRLDLAALGMLHRPTRPATVCPACWRTWSASPAPLAAGYCHHRQTAWRIRASGTVRTITCTRAEYRDLLASLETKS